MSRIGLRPVSEIDRARIEAWLRLPEIQAWWGSLGAAQAEIRLALGDGSAVCRIVEADGVPVGYVQAVDVAGWGARRPVEMPAGAYEVDVFIAAPEHRGSYAGPRALALLVDEVFATTLAVACVGVVSIRNEAAVRAYERTGFAWQRIIQDALLGPCWLMVLPRAA